MTFAALDGQRLTAVRLHVPAIGAWFAECDLESAPTVGPRSVLTIGELTLTGTVVAQQDGVFGERRLLRLVGGGGGWGSFVSARAYHNDAGVKARLVAEDVAREAGEVLGQFVPATERLGNDYVRGASQSASRVLEDVSGDDVAWWVDFAGLTHVGARPAAAAVLEADYQVTAYDPRARLATLVVRDPSVVQIGTALAGPSLPAAQTVREYGVQVDASGVRILAWCGGSEGSAGRLAGLWRALANQVNGDELFGLYRYRVVAMAADGRVSLQAVRRAAGLPDIEPISQWPGVAGTHAQLTPGAEVLVAFVEGDRAQPVVTHYAGRGGIGFVPVSLTLGGATGLPAAKQNDTVEVLLPPGVFSGTINGLPATGLITFPLMTTLGSITTGSSKVNIAP